MEFTLYKLRHRVNMEKEKKANVVIIDLYFTPIGKGEYCGRLQLQMCFHLWANFVNVYQTLIFAPNSAPLP